MAEGHSHINVALLPDVYEPKNSLIYNEKYEGQKLRNVEVMNNTYSLRRQTYVGEKAQLEIHLINMESEQEGLIQGIQCFLAPAMRGGDSHHKWLSMGPWHSNSFADEAAKLCYWWAHSFFVLVYANNFNLGVFDWEDLFLVNLHISAKFIH